MSNNIIGEHLKIARTNCQLTQRELAARLQLIDFHIDRGGIAKIESGIRKVTDVELVKIAQALNIKSSQLLGE